jgi:hypothetical protein
MFRLARTPTRSEKRPSARPFIMFFRAYRETFAFLSVCIIRVFDVQTCEDSNKKQIPSIMFFRGSREMFAFLSVCIIRVSDVQTCEDPNKKRMKTFSKTLHNVLQDLQRNVCFSLCILL